jgi:membrane protease YdiL (CAAX protease family)
MRNLFTKIATATGAGLLGLAIALVPGGIWGALYMLNLKTGPSIPWAVLPMGAVLWVLWHYLSGHGRPRRTSQLRRALLRARSVPPPVFAWSLVAGALAVVALAGYWILMFQLVRMPGNSLPALGQYPLLTMAFFIVMGSLVSPLSEEAGLRGYCQVILERNFRAPIAVLISSVFFAFGHINHGMLWPKLMVYFLAGLAFGSIDSLTKSTLPGIPVHMLGDLTFFALVWPYDTARRLIWDTGADAWFWIHVAQAVLFTALAILAYCQLARASKSSRRSGFEETPAATGTPSMPPYPIRALTL